jgi:lysophospholipase L1-like esterase
MSHNNHTWLKRAGCGLAISLVLVLGVFCTVRTRYENRLRQQIWPTQMPEIKITASPVRGAVPTVMLLGDSRMAEWGLPELNHWRVVNAGAGGLTTGQIRLATPKLLDEIHPDLVVLQAGINDLKFLGLKPRMNAAIVSLAASNLMVIVSECQKRHCRVIVLETWPTGQPDWLRRLVWNETVPASVNQFNTELRKLSAPEQGIRVVDLFGEAGLKPGAGSYRDTLHFRPEVYRQLTPALQNELDEAFAKMKILL